MSHPRNTLSTILARVVIDPDTECWYWPGARCRGYGHVRWDGRQRLVHRLVYILLVGLIPDLLELDHLCRVRWCCNPIHLEPVTAAVNVQRSWKMGPTAKRLRPHGPDGRFARVA